MYQEIMTFWFEEIDESQWWKKDLQFDQMISERFSDIHAKASRCELYDWRETPEGRLAEIIVLDQFSRNIYRDSSHAFANDSLALGLAQEALRLKADSEVSRKQKSFFYLPFMHSESPAIHDIALALYEAYGEPGNLDFEQRHKAVIDRFGRYPHRNEALGRTSSAEEKAFLTEPGSGF